MNIYTDTQNFYLKSVVEECFWRSN